MTNKLQSLPKNTVTLRNHFKTILDSAKDYGWQVCLKKTKVQVKAIANQLNLDAEEAFILPFLMNYCSFEEMEQDIDCCCVDFLVFSKAIRRLEADGIVHFKYDEKIWMCVESKINEILTEGKLTILDYAELDTFEIFRKMRTLCCFGEDYSAAVDAEFVKLIKKLVASRNPIISHLLVKGNNRKQENLFRSAFFLIAFYSACELENCFRVEKILHLLNHRTKVFANITKEMAKQFLAELEEKNIIFAHADNSGNYSFCKKFSIGLDCDFEAWYDDQEDKEDLPQAFSVIKPENIFVRKLYYNSTEQTEVEKLGKLFSDEYLGKAQQKLMEQGRPGIICLFHGAPGTGKTETCLQLAAKTGREIYLVDVSGLRNRYVGDSEKAFRKLFADYNDAINKAKEQGKPIPMLLLNEADGIISKRVDVVDSSDQLNNSVQNIILQEFESTKGIILCTTNLTNNMDTAFERRFLYKVEFHLPGEEVRASIWKDKFSTLSDMECAQLAHDYDFSGGLIENVVRKTILDTLLSDNGPSLETIKQIASTEKEKAPTIFQIAGFSKKVS